MRTNFKNYNVQDLLETVETDLGIPLNTSCQRTEFQLPKKIGDGFFSTCLFSDGLTLFLINATLLKDWEWVFNGEEDSPAFLFFSLRGGIEDAEKCVLKPLHTVLIVQQGGGSSRVMTFKKDEPISLAVLQIDYKKYFAEKASSSEDLPVKMRVMLSLGGAEIKCLMAPNRTTPETAQLVKDMIECPYNGLLKTCMIEAKARQFLALAIQRMEEDSLEPEESTKLAALDYQKMQEAKDILINNLSKPPTIEELSRKVGVNRQKLKQDFKAAFEKSIYQYLVNERMNTARKMMMEHPSPILEVAEKVGYENASHFSKRFKAHFGILPSKFHSMIWRNGQNN